MFRHIKFLAILAVVFVSLFALNASQSHTVDAQTDNKTIVKAFYDAYNAAIKSGNTKQAETLLDQDFIDEDAPSSMSGIQFFEQTVASNHIAFPDAQFTIQQIVAEGDQVAVYSTLTGTNSGAMGQVPATGQQISAKAMDMLTLKDGKISHRASLVDNYAILSELGFTILPPHPQPGTPIPGATAPANIAPATVAPSASTPAATVAATAALGQ